MFRSYFPQDKRTAEKAAGGEMRMETDNAVLGSIGRKRVCFALARPNGFVRSDTIRTYQAQTVNGVSAALGAFQRDLGLPTLPRRSALSVPGLVRGDAISIAGTSWFLSRSGLQAMLGEPPLVLNDFAAEAWALCVAGGRVREAFHGTIDCPIRNAGTFLVVGITSGLGVAAIHRSETGVVTVLPTEAGHGAFADATKELADLADSLSRGRYPVIAEEIVSAPGLVAVYQLLSCQRGSVPRAQTPEEITRSVSVDPVARAACDLLAKAFWSQAGSLVLGLGTWDGLLVTGAVAHALLPALRQPEAQALFIASQKYRRALSELPRALVSYENAELIGLGEALRHRWSGHA
jgi:glucokinase